MLDAKAPDFTLPTTGGSHFSLAAHAGKIVVIYFYPKDSTPGCTTEAQQFRDLHDRFAAVDAVILGISRDSLKSHENFKAKLAFPTEQETSLQALLFGSKDAPDPKENQPSLRALPFELASDADETVCKLFGVIKMKNMYGKQVRGIERSTFVIDPKGVLRREWRGVKVPGHAQEVLDFVQTL